MNEPANEIREPARRAPLPAAARERLTSLLRDELHRLCAAAIDAGLPPRTVAAALVARRLALDAHSVGDDDVEHRFDQPGQRGRVEE